MLVILLVLVIFTNISLVVTLIRMSTKHKNLFENMAFGGIVYGSVNKLARLIEFIITRKFLDLNDRLLSVS